MNLHALAIDEHRWPFEAALWRMPPFKKYDTAVEQVWFSGAHADVGGGYIVEESRDRKAAYADDITLSGFYRAGALRLPQGDGDSGGFRGILQGDIEGLFVQHRVNEMQTLRMKGIAEALEEAWCGQRAHA